jgi:hypothetical protein
MTLSRRFALSFFLAALFLTPLAAPLAGTVLSFHPDFPADVPSGCLEAEPDMALLPGGGYVVVWQGGSDASGSGQIQARIFNSGDNTADPSFRVSSGAGILPAVAARPDGHFLVVWRDRDGNGIRARLFGPTGAPAAPQITLSSFSSDNTEMDVAALPDGRFAVLWNGHASLELNLVSADGQSSEPAAQVEGYAGITGVDPLVESPAIAAQPDGGLAMVWTVRNSLSILEFWEIDGAILTASAGVRQLDVGSGSPAGKIAGTTIATDAAGNIVVAWKEDALGEVPNRIAVQLFDDAGQPRTLPFRADEAPPLSGSWQTIGAPALALGPEGFFAVAWDATPALDPVGTPRPVSNQVYARVFEADGDPLGPQRMISPDDLRGSHDPALVWAQGRELVAAWRRDPGLPPAAPCFSDGIRLRRIFTGCLPNADRLCLGDGRFELGVTWNAPAAGTGAGKAVALTRDTGYFWFFGQDNVELVVKVLDGRTINDHFWVFYGSLSDVAWTLKVEDLLTGGERLYGNPQGQLASRGDTQALAASTAGSAEGVQVEAFDAVRLDRDALPAGPESAIPAPVTAAAPAGSPVLTLNGDFQVDVTWRDPFNGGSGIGQGVPLTGDSGYFWFFGPENVELAVKVLDARAVNGKYWVFYGALTNVEYDLRVRFNGQEKVYHNPPFRFLSRADTAAFDAN